MKVKRKSFSLWHSCVGMSFLLLIEWVLLLWMGESVVYTDLRWMWLLLFAFIGGLITVVLATEVISEVRNQIHMLVLLSAVCLEFVLYFAFQYGYLLMLIPNGFQNMASDPVSLLLQSVMVFVFNPIYLPGTSAARGLLLINTFAALALVLFILQNIWQVRAAEGVK